AVISPAEFDDPAARERRFADHQHVDELLVSQDGDEHDELSAVSRLALLARLLRPVNRVATKRILAEARAKVWDNTAAMDRARRESPQRYAEVLGELEALSAARVADLVAPGQVLLKLARRGFGVRLS